MATTIAQPIMPLATAFTEEDELSPRTGANPAAFTTEPESHLRIVVSRKARRSDEYGGVAQDPTALPAWIEPTVTALLDLQALPENWDSYGAPSIKKSLIEKVLQTLTNVMDEKSPVPSVVPLNDGGIQLEWHRHRQDLEIAFPVDDAPQFFYCNRETGEEAEGRPTRVSLIGKFVRDLA
jgi:hypothetical protein